MDRQIRTHDRDGFQAQDDAYAIVCGCQKTFRAWRRAKDPAAQSELNQAYRAALEALLLLLEADLDTMVRQWLSSQDIPEIVADQNYRLVMQEVVDHLVLNIFTAIVQPLPKIVFDANMNIREVLLALAERSLYNRY